MERYVLRSAIDLLAKQNLPIHILSFSRLKIKRIHFLIQNHLTHTNSSEGLIIYTHIFAGLGTRIEFKETKLALLVGLFICISSLLPQQAPHRGSPFLGTMSRICPSTLIYSFDSRLELFFKFCQIVARHNAALPHQIFKSSTALHSLSI